jgi:hypothetical protein
MEEKLNELLEKAELKLIEYDRTRIEISHKMTFLREHGFNKESEWLRHQKDSMFWSIIKMIDVFEDYKDTVRNIRDMLNKWQS